MTADPSRRALIAALASIAAVPAPGLAALAAQTETALGARVGVYGRTLSGSQRVAHHADERFAMCSTFKLLLAAAVLARIDAGAEQAGRRIAYGAADLLGHAPLTRAHLPQGAMSVEDLCAAAVTQSDNTAANLLLRAIGGPAAVTAFARRLGDAVTRLDRIEPALNEVPPGDARDTTSPAAMVEDVRRLVFGQALAAPSRARITAWLKACQTGDARIRAGAPAGAQVGDKTGSWNGGGLVVANDVAVIWPARGEPLILAIYIWGSRQSGARTDAAIAALARGACAELGAA